MKLFSRKKSRDEDEMRTSSGGKNEVDLPLATIVRSWDGITTVFQVTIPDYAKPGEEFQAYSGSRIVRVRCPPDSRPGQSLQITVPTDPNPTGVGGSGGGNAARSPPDSPTIRATDLKFRCVRTDDKGDVALKERFFMNKSAYVRKLELRQGDDRRIRTGILSLVPASESVVDSEIRSAHICDLVSYSDLGQAQVKNFKVKTQWFQRKCSQLRVGWNEGHISMKLRRQFLLRDSVDAVMSLSRKDLRKWWRFEFIGEMCIDQGSSAWAREWFELVSNEVFDPKKGLWQSSTTNQRSMTINPASELCCDGHLMYYRFLGRVMGKAMFDRQLVNGHMVKHIYKHILAWPIMFKDLESVDEEYYNSLKRLQSMAESGEDLSMLCLDFTTTFEILGVKVEVELVKGGKNIELTNDNCPEYVEACLKYKLMECVKPQLSELLLGLFDVIPERLLTIFDFQELEWLMCGLPEIDMED